MAQHASKAITSHIVTSGPGWSAITRDTNASLPPVSSGKRPGAPAGDGGPPALSLCSRQTSGLSGTEAAGAQALAARECAAIQQALHTRALADQSWELYELIDAWSRAADMPRRVPAAHPPELLAGASAHFYGVAAARVRRHRRALQRLAHVRATRGAHADALSTASAQGCAPRPPHKDRAGIL
jgi:hypothetical protein